MKSNTSIWSDVVHELNVGYQMHSAPIYNKILATFLLKFNQSEQCPQHKSRILWHIYTIAFIFGILGFWTIILGFWKKIWGFVKRFQVFIKKLWGFVIWNIIGMIMTKERKMFVSWYKLNIEDIASFIKSGQALNF